MKRFGSLIASLMAVLFSGCHANDSVFHLTNEKSLHVILYNGGRIIREFDMPGVSPEIRMADELLKKKDGKWQITFVTYAPLILIKGSNYSVNIQKGKLIVNSEKAPGQSRQVASNLSPEEFDSMKSAFEHEQPFKTAPSQ